MDIISTVSLCLLHSTQNQSVNYVLILFVLQLYTLSQEPGRKEFLDSLFAYMQQNGML